MKNKNGLRDHVVVANGKFLQTMDKIKDKLNYFDQVVLEAYDNDIESAIIVTQHLTGIGYVKYQSFTNQLAIVKDNKQVPKIMIKLQYVPPPQKEQNSTHQNQRKQYRTRQNQRVNDDYQDKKLSKNKPAYKQSQPNNSNSKNYRQKK